MTFHRVTGLALLCVLVGGPADVQAGGKEKCIAAMTKLYDTGAKCLDAAIKKVVDDCLKEVTGQGNVKKQVETYCKGPKSAEKKMNQCLDKKKVDRKRLKQQLDRCG